MIEYKNLDAEVLGAVKDANVLVRNQFVVKVYSILSVQLILTTIVMAPFLALPHLWIKYNNWALYLAYAILIMTIFVTSCSGNSIRVFPRNYFMLGFISVGMGVVLGLICNFYSIKSVFLSGLLTILVFNMLTAYACATKRDFTGVGTYLFGVLIILLVFGFTIPVLCWMGVPITWLKMSYNLLGVFVFTFYIIYDTQMIIGGKHANQF